jgi:hypothetical protein
MPGKSKTKSSAVNAKGAKPNARRRPAGKRRRPHNATRSQNSETIDDLVMKVSQEPRQVMKDGELVKMSRGERNMRAEIDAALKGEVRALNYLLGLMAKYPRSVDRSPLGIDIFINGHLANL